MKKGTSNSENLSRGSKVIAFIITGALVVGALFLFSTQTEYGIIGGIAALFTIPVVWIVNYLLLTICDMENHIYTLNQNLVELAKFVMKQKDKKETDISDKT